MSKNQFVGRDSFYRMKYLYQISNICRKKPGDDYTKLMLHYGSQLVSIGKKTQNRMSPRMKRTICKICNAILTPGDTERLSFAKIKGQPNKLICTCVICGAEKSFCLRKDYKLWCEKSESIVKVFDMHENPIIDDNISKQNKSSKFITCQSSIEALKDKVNCKKNTSAVKSNVTTGESEDTIKSCINILTKSINNENCFNMEVNNVNKTSNDVETNISRSFDMESKDIVHENSSNLIPKDASIENDKMQFMET